MMATKSAYWVLCVTMATVSTLQAKMYDLSHDHGMKTLMSPDNPRYRVKKIFEGDIQPGIYHLFYIEMNKGPQYVLSAKFNSYSLGEHGGTHLDAPLHFHRGGKTLDKIPLEDTIADGVMIDCSRETAKNQMYALTLDKLKQWEKKNGKIPNGAAVVLNFNWSHKFNDSSLYFNTNDLDDTGTYKFPHVGKEACDWLVDERKVKILAIDTASPDLLKSNFPTHVKFLQNNKIIVENLRDPGRLPPRGFRLYATPVKFVGATGVQVRAFAITQDISNRATKTDGRFFSLCGTALIVSYLSRFLPFV